MYLRGRYRSRRYSDLAVVSRVDQSRKADFPRTHTGAVFFLLFLEKSVIPRALARRYKYARRGSHAFLGRRDCRANAIFESDLRYLRNNICTGDVPRASSKNFDFRWKLISFRNPSFCDTQLARVMAWRLVSKFNKIVCVCVFSIRGSGAFLSSAWVHERRITSTALKNRNVIHKYNVIGHENVNKFDDNKN